jgi:hypothetical protein
MGELIVQDDRELRRIERAIASIEGRPVCDQLRMQSLLMALQAERSLLQGTGRRPVMVVKRQASVPAGLIG